MGDYPPRTVRLGPGAEFDWIRAAIASGGELPAAVRVGPGDDAAVIEGRPYHAPRDEPGQVAPQAEAGIVGTPIVVMP